MEGLSNKKVFLLDLDGTLINSANTVLESLTRALNSNEVPLNEPLSSKLIGPPISEIINKITPESPDSLIQDIIKDFYNIYDQELCLDCSLYEGAKDFLGKLKKLERDVFLVTNKREIPVRKIIAHLGLNKFFYNIYTIDSIKDISISSKLDLLRAVSKIEGIDYSEAVYIGDTTSDYIACKENGLDFIFAEWGYGSCDDLSCARVKSFYDL